MKASIHNKDIIGVDFDGEAIYHEDYITDEYNNRHELSEFVGFDGTITVHYDLDSGEKTEVHVGEFDTNHFKDFTILDS
tara:strand:+ start:234 stop:470 length:237 start_codon:yes stop_codon:yes gene_type:complete